jgi:hypothetical protein
MRRYQIRLQEFRERAGMFECSGGSFRKIDGGENGLNIQHRGVFPERGL